MDQSTQRRLRMTALASIAVCVNAVSPAFAANDVLTPTTRLYVDWFGSAISSASQLTGQDRSNAVLIAGNPIATWITSGTPAQVQARAAKLVADAAAENSVPVIVAYNVPFRDCQQYSSCGAANTAEYKAWINGLAAGIGSAKAVVLVEPD